MIESDILLKKKISLSLFTFEISPLSSIEPKSSILISVGDGQLRKKNFDRKNLALNYLLELNILVYGPKNWGVLIINVFQINNLSLNFVKLVSKRTLFEILKCKGITDMIRLKLIFID